MRHITVVGGGWAGLSAAVAVCQGGHRVTLLEASPHWGGRARRVLRPWPGHWPNPSGHTHLALDNGQHILIGAYQATLGLMQTVGLDPADLLQPMPLSLPFPDGSGMTTPTWAARWPPQWSLLAAVATAHGWSWGEKFTLLLALARWRRQQFDAPEQQTVAELCEHLPPPVMRALIDPLCVAALNTPVERASARVFLRVLRDALQLPGGLGWRASDLLLPRQDLGRLLPDTATAWLAQQGATLATGQRAQALERLPTGLWRIDLGSDTPPLQADGVVLACTAPEAARLVGSAANRCTGPDRDALTEWQGVASRLTHEAIATVYLVTPERPAGLTRSPMLALYSGRTRGPAQFVLDRSQLGADSGGLPQGHLLAFVASACDTDRRTLESDVLQQAREQLGLDTCEVLHTVVEKRATFACLPGIARPGTFVTQGLTAAGDYVAGPYPATLEGAVQSGQAAARLLTSPDGAGGGRPREPDSASATA